MPYEGEFAHYRPLRRLYESTRVKELLGRFHIRRWTEAADTESDLSLVEFPEPEWMPDWVLAVDGSHAEVPVENGYPGAEASYVTVASVLLDMKRTAQLDKHRPVDPREFKQTERAESIDAALPGCNVVYENERSAESSLRRAVFEVSGGQRMIEDGESLLETYEALLGYKPAVEKQNCPYRNDGCGSPDFAFTRGLGSYLCSCSNQLPLYSTDALRVHEGMQPSAGRNGALFAEVMQIFERVWIVHILRSLEQKGWLSSLRRLAIVMDGPLAVFGHPAWLSQAIAAELERINTKVRVATGGHDLLMVGIEKSGEFCDHFAAIDLDSSGNPGKFPRRTAALLSDKYIKRNVVLSTSDKPYGQDTYFGRKLFYKTSSGALIVATIPFLSEQSRDTSTCNVDQYPRLFDAVGILDKLVSSRYPNALAPLVSAHAEAAIPLNVGRKVLEQLAREMVATA